MRWCYYRKTCGYNIEKDNNGAASSSKIDEHDFECSISSQLSRDFVSASETEVQLISSCNYYKHYYYYYYSRKGNYLSNHQKHKFAIKLSHCRFPVLYCLTR